MKQVPLLSRKVSEELFGKCICDLSNTIVASNAQLSGEILLFQRLTGWQENEVNNVSNLYPFFPVVGNLSQWAASKVCCWCLSHFPVLASVKSSFTWHIFKCHPVKLQPCILCVSLTGRTTKSKISLNNCFVSHEVFFTALTQWLQGVAKANFRCRLLERRRWIDCSGVVGSWMPLWC